MLQTMRSTDIVLNPTTNLARSSIAVSVFAGHAHYQCHERDKRGASPPHYRLDQARHQTDYIGMVTANAMKLN